VEQVPQHSILGRKSIEESCALDIALAIQSLMDKGDQVRIPSRQLGTFLSQHLLCSDLLGQAFLQHSGLSANAFHVCDLSTEPTHFSYKSLQRSVTVTKTVFHDQMVMQHGMEIITRLGRMLRVKLQYFGKRF
jgi:hypothetical protein